MVAYWWLKPSVSFKLGRLPFGAAGFRVNFISCRRWCKGRSRLRRGDALGIDLEDDFEGEVRPAQALHREAGRRPPLPPSPSSALVAGSSGRATALSAMALPGPSSASAGAPP